MDTIEEKKKKAALLRKKKAVIKEKKKSKADKSDAKHRKVSQKRRRVLEVRAMYPEYTHADIGDKLDMSAAQVSRCLRTRIAQEALSAIERSETDYLIAMRKKSIALLDAVICNPEEDIALRVSTAKFIAKNVVDRTEEAQPHTLIFETCIAENGALTKNVRKLFEGDYEKDVTPEES